MAALLVALTIMAVFLGMALPAWRTASQREKEAELIFRGQQYARAIMLFQRKYANTFPPNVDILLNEHFLRKKYKDPITDGEFQVVYANQQASAQPGPGGQQGAPGAQSGTGIVPTQGQPAQRTTTVGSGTSSIGAQGGIVGVTSKSTATSIRLYNGRDKYNEWVFVAQQTSGRAGAPNGSQNPTGNPFGGAPGAIDGRGGRGGPPGQGFPGRGDVPGGRQGQPPGAQRPGGPGGGARGGPGSIFQGDSPLFPGRR